MAGTTGAWAIDLDKKDANLAKLMSVIDVRYRWSIGDIAYGLKHLYPEAPENLWLVKNAIGKFFKDGGRVADFSPKELCETYVEACLNERVVPHKCSDLIRAMIKGHNELLGRYEDRNRETLSMEDMDKEVSVGEGALPCDEISDEKLAGVCVATKSMLMDSDKYRDGLLTVSPNTVYQDCLHSNHLHVTANYCYDITELFITKVNAGARTNQRMYDEYSSTMKPTIVSEIQDKIDDILPD